MKKDIIIIGGGTAGLSLARSLADTNLNIIIIEKQTVKQLAFAAYDGREIAVTHFSKKILNILINGLVIKRFGKTDIAHIGNSC